MIDRCFICGKELGMNCIDIIERSKGNESEKRVNQIFCLANFELLDVNKTFLEDSGDEIGEIDGIWCFEKTIILVEVTESPYKLSDKIYKFFTKWNEENYGNLIRSTYKNKAYEVKRVFVDLSKFTPVKPSKTVIDFSKKDNCHFLFLDDIKFFEELIGSIGEYVIAEILRKLDFKMEKHRKEIVAMKALIGEQIVYVFSYPVKDLLKICYVSRRKNRHGYQRILSKIRLKRIGESVKKKETITFPNSIIVRPEKPIDILKEEDNVVVLNLPNNYCSLKVIDGQHRLYGFTKVDNDLINDYNLIVVLINKIEDNKEILTFITINTEFKRVDASLVYNLKADLKGIVSNHEFYDDIFAVKVARILDEKSVIKGKIFFGEYDEVLVKEEKPLRLATLVEALKKNKIISKTSILNIPLRSTKVFYEIINEIFTVLVNTNIKSKELLFDNRGIRLLFRLTRLSIENINAGRITLDFNEFLVDFARLLDAKFIKKLFVYYGEGGANNAADLVIRELRGIKPAYKRFGTDLRYI